MDEHNFYSIDRLMEFGMGMAIAQQMVKTMNESISNMHVPGSVISGSGQGFFFAVVEGKQMGPLSEEDVARLIREKKIVNETYMWKPSLSAWMLAEHIPEVVRLAALTPPPLPPNISQP
ncbi:MAG: DUF4339 domain-containing protein [Flavobacteriales bacterium]|nr:DUF4339 domain-containing protein [Flavobacteriales bacterium]